MSSDSKMVLFAHKSFNNQQFQEEKSSRKKKLKDKELTY